MRATRRGLVLGAGAALVPTPLMPSILLAAPEPAPVTPEPLALTGRFVQGGHAVGRAWPRAMVLVNGEALATASEEGWFVVGFDRDAPASVELEVRSGDQAERRTLAIEPGQFPSTVINGLPQETVEPSSPALLERIRREAARKAEAFSSRTDADHFRDGFRWPLAEFRVSSRWGSQRVLNGTPARPHYGIDMAAPAGTPILAPAAGLVIMAEPDLHFEGGLILIDHGQGLITAYLHQSELIATPGRQVAAGEIIGRVGMKGRATGPHLCWRMRWRDRQCDPSLMVRA